MSKNLQKNVKIVLLESKFLGNFDVFDQEHYMKGKESFANVFRPEKKDKDGLRVPRRPHIEVTE